MVRMYMVMGGRSNGSVPCPSSRKRSSPAKVTTDMSLLHTRSNAATRDDSPSPKFGRSAEGYSTSAGSIAATASCMANVGLGQCSPWYPSPKREGNSSAQSKRRYYEHQSLDLGYRNCNCITCAIFSVEPELY